MLKQVSHISLIVASVLTVQALATGVGDFVAKRNLDRARDYESQFLKNFATSMTEYGLSYEIAHNNHMMDHDRTLWLPEGVK